MNKHLIILPILLTSAISLHALSFYLEEPEQIAQNPTPTISSSSQPSGEASKEPINTSSNNPNPSGSPALVASNGSSKPIDPNKTPEPAKSGEVKQGSNSQPSPKPVESKKPVPVASASVIPVATPTPKVDKIEIATNYIKPKNTNDIVKEARMLGGRLDPFLSLRPPEIREIPPIPVIEEDLKNVSTSKSSKTGISKAPNLPVKRTPPPGETSQQRSNRLAQEKREADAIKKANAKKISDEKVTAAAEAKLEKEKAMNDIKIEIKNTISKNLILNGIISGQKPFAIISVKTKDGNESKVVAKNEELMEIGGDKIRVIAINTINNTVTVSNDNIAKIPNGKTTFVLSIKDES
ncbi:MAG: hypothetical protein AABZ74_09225 [Cyanobacteriota bacterium]